MNQWLGCIGNQVVAVAFLASAAGAPLLWAAMRVGQPLLVGFAVMAFAVWIAASWFLARAFARQLRALESELLARANAAQSNGAPAADARKATATTWLPIQPSH
jgi:hypothetical protein